MKPKKIVKNAKTWATKDLAVLSRFVEQLIVIILQSVPLLFFLMMFDVLFTHSIIVVCFCLHYLFCLHCVFSLKCWFLHIFGASSPFSKRCLVWVHIQSSFIQFLVGLNVKQTFQFRLFNSDRSNVLSNCYVTWSGFCQPFEIGRWNFHVHLFLVICLWLQFRYSWMVFCLVLPGVSWMSSYVFEKQFL